MISNFQIGKNGLTDGVIESLNLAFKKNKIVRISVLKSASRSKEEIKEMAEKIAKSLAGNYVYRIIGFTIILRKKAKNK
jgi:RNA-binding protein